MNTLYTFPSSGNMDVMRQEWDDQERQDYNRIQFIGIVVTAWLLFCLMGCAPKVLLTPSLASAESSNAAIKKSVTTAQQDINTVLKDNAIIARPDLTMDLQDANGQLIAAQTTIAAQSSDLVEKQNQINSVVAQGNEAIAAKAAMEPIQKRDREALVVAWVLCSLACIMGPLIFKAYPALVFFPTSLEAIVCSFAAFLICSGIAGMLILFGVL